MPEDAASKIQRHLGSGILVDTNLLLAYFVGLYDDVSGYRIINNFRYTRGRYDTGDFETLLALLERFDNRVTTPHILTEVSNMLGQLSEPARAACFDLLKRTMPPLNEVNVSGRRLSDDEAFTRFGVADTAVRIAAEGSYLVLTDDFRLSGYLDKIGVDVLNFHHVKRLG